MAPDKRRGGSSTPPPADSTVWAHDQAFLARVPPPPRVPSARARKLVFGYQGTQKYALLGGVLAIVLGSFFAYFFVGRLPLDLLIDVAGSTHVDGRIVDTFVDRTVSVNDDHPHMVRFSYAVDGRSFEGVSATFDEAFATAQKRGMSTTIEVARSNPRAARVVGTRCSAFGYMGGLVLLIPALGALAVAWAVRGNRREISAFRDGRATVAKVVFSGAGTPISENAPRLYKVKWRFTVSGQMYEGAISVDAANAHLLDEVMTDKRIAVVYLPRDPSVHTVYVD